jgi:hypothetical protein
MRPNPDTVAILRRMDPAELLLALYRQGSALSRPPGESRDDWDERTMTVIMAGAYKARVAAGAQVFTRSEINDSIRWLQDHGFRSGRFDA